jgi:aminoglycoside N3'-acetyltransferase
MSYPPADLFDDPEFVPLTRSQIAHGLAELGVVEGDTLMVHVRLSALRFRSGHLAGRMPIATYRHLIRLCLRRAETSVAFQSACAPGWEPSAGLHPEVSFTALGPQATSLLAGSDGDDPWGSDGPLGRLVSTGGRVLMLGAPLTTLTLCHHAEAIADVTGKRYRSYRMPVGTDRGASWRDYTTLDTFYGALPYWERPEFAIESAVGILAAQAVRAGAGTKGELGTATTWLFDAPSTVQAVVAWIERNF